MAEACHPVLPPHRIRMHDVERAAFLPRMPTRPRDAMKAIFGDKVFYQQYFQEVGNADADLERDPRTALLAFMYSLSGDAAPSERWRYLFDRGEHLMDTVTVPKQLPPWLSDSDLDFFANEFRRTGVDAALNWYRNIDRFWELKAFLDGARLAHPHHFTAGQKDHVIE